MQWKLVQRPLIETILILKVVNVFLQFFIYNFNFKREKIIKIKL